MHQPSLSRAERMAWYQDARFGMFIHWGAYTVAGVEASWPIMTPELSEAMFATTRRIAEADYVALPARFNPVDFDADAWVRAAQAAGMRYIVVGAKHHDGFCMFDAPGTDYKITNTPFGRDVCAELAQACARAGMPLGFYYSPPDLHHPGYRDTRKPATQNWTGEPKRKEWAGYLDYMESHLRKLLTEYGDVAVIWFDGLTNHGKYDPERFHRLVHELSPRTLINDRLGDGFDFITPEQFIPKDGIPARTGKPNPGLDPGGDGFFRLMCSLARLPLVGGWVKKQVAKYRDGTATLSKVHQEPYPSPQRFQPWETCMTMGNTWGFNPDETEWKAPETLVQNLVKVVSRGGNYLLNVGPDPLGRFPPEAVERLQHVGGWMAKYGAAVYGATYSPLQNVPWGAATRSGDCLHLHVFDWPGDGKLVVEGFPGRARSAGLLGGEALPLRQEGDRVEIAVPPTAPDPDVSVVTVGIDPADKGWRAYSAPVTLATPWQDYLRKNARNSFIINAVINGLLAWASYAGRGPLPYGEVAVDVLIAVFIIAYINSWLLILGARGEYAKGNLSGTPARRLRVPLPRGAGLRALVLTLASVVMFGGLVDALILLFSPEVVGNWTYIVVKTLYTGLAGALAVALGVLSVVWEQRGK